MNSKKILIIACIGICIISCDHDLITVPGSYTWRAPPVYDDSGVTRTLKVAAVSFDVDLSPEVNCNKIIAFIDKIKTEKLDVRLILFPETTLGYYYRSSNPFEYQKSIAETIPGVTTNAVCLKAIEYQIYISFGMVEISGDDLYNSQVLIDPYGTILSVHHKNNFIDWDKENGFKAGSDITLNVIDGIKVATIICYDYMSYKINKKIHASGAELVLLPVANTTSFISDLNPLGQFIYTWVLSANRVGKEDGIDYDGLLFLNTPSGETRIKTIGMEGYIYGEVRCK